ncbi:MAG: mannose-1-phosphate guanylyltransferase [Sumerlaeia bacterium]
MNPIRVAVIMAGGSGERFWPLSRNSRPKQLLKLSCPDQTMLEEAVSRALPLFDAKNVFISTSERLREVIARGDRRIATENILAEPARRDTTGAMIWVTAQLMARYGEDQPITMAVLTADQLIGNPDGFRQSVERAMDCAERENALVTIGIPPDRPETGYGYIEAQTREPANGRANGPIRVAAYHEKPNRERAEEYLRAGNFYWNSGMFFWSLTKFLEEFQVAQPDMAANIHRIAETLHSGDHARAVAQFESLESISIDYSLMERARDVRMIPATFSWDDIGTWDALSRCRECDERGNVCIGDPVLVDSSNCIVYNEPGASERAVALVGVKDLVVVVSGDSVLVTHKDHVQDVKGVVKELKRRGARQV